MADEGPSAALDKEPEPDKAGRARPPSPYFFGSRFFEWKHRFSWEGIESVVPVPITDRDPGDEDDGKKRLLPARWDARAYAKGETG